MAVVVLVGARLSGHASSMSPTPSVTVETRSSDEPPAPLVMESTSAPSCFRIEASATISSVSPE